MKEKGIVIIKEKQKTKKSISAFHTTNFFPPYSTLVINVHSFIITTLMTTSFKRKSFSRAFILFHFLQFYFYIFFQKAYCFIFLFLCFPFPLLGICKTFFHNFFLVILMGFVSTFYKLKNIVACFQRNLYNKKLNGKIRRGTKINDVWKHSQIK